MRKVLALSLLAISLTACTAFQAQHSFDATKCAPLLQLEPAVQAAVINCIEQK